MRRLAAALTIAAGLVLFGATPAGATTCIYPGAVGVGPYSVQPPVVCLPVP